MVSAIALVLISLIILGFFHSVSSLTNDTSAKNNMPFYVGVTYCGNSTTEAKLLIDKVKNYTNLFVLQSGSLQSQNATETIGDYAVANGLHFSFYLSVDAVNRYNLTVSTAKQRWGGMFLGIYYEDEPGGKMLDSYVPFSLPDHKERITKLGNGAVSLDFENETIVTYFSNGSILMLQDLGPSMSGTLRVTHVNGTTERYENVPMPSVGANYTYPNGTSIRWSPFPIRNQISYLPDGTFLSQNGEAPLYSAILAYNPLGNCDDAAEAFVNRNSALLEPIRNQGVTTFTSDYGLYWWDYQSGYDFVLAELGWNSSISQQIALNRGAAAAHNKSWGAIITWTYDKVPYLVNGTEMFNELKTAYRAGAKYLVVFNYPALEGNPYGILQKEHFDALQQFWTEVVQNPKIINGENAAQVALVLSNNYGIGLRNPTDSIWGVLASNETSRQIWNLVQDKLADYGDQLDIVFGEPAAGTYEHVYYWNQAQDPLPKQDFALPIAIATITVIAVAAIVLVYLMKQRRN